MDAVPVGCLSFPVIMMTDWAPVWTQGLGREHLANVVVRGDNRNVRDIKVSSGQRMIEAAHTTVFDSARLQK